MSFVLKLNQVSKTFGKTLVLKPLDLNIEKSEFLSLLGPSGCGKTTTLRLIAGLEEPTSGDIWLNDQKVAGEGLFVPPEKRGLGMVFQSYAIWPHMTVFENIAYPLKIRKTNKDEIQTRVTDLLNTLNLKGLGHRYPSELSGGQQQRVALGRALAFRPKIMLLDEPLSNLDAKLRIEMRAEIKMLQREFNMTVIYVTHDQTEAFDLSNRIVLMNQGAVEQVGTPQEILNQPQSAFVREFTQT